MGTHGYELVVLTCITHAAVEAVVSVVLNPICCSCIWCLFNVIPFCELFSLPTDHPRFEVAFSTVKPEMFT